MTLSRKVRLLGLICVIACTVGCDQTSKHLARTALSQARFLSLPGGLGELRLAENPGAFLSLGAVLPESVRLAIFTVGVGLGLALLFAYLTTYAPMGLGRFAGLSLVLAGGISNLLDRILRQGLVTDFVTIQLGPFRTGVFNLADVLILTGVGVMISTMLRLTRSHSAIPPSTGSH